MYKFYCLKKYCELYCRLTNHSTNNTRMIILGEDGMRSHYVNREPTVKILKRPTKNQDSDNVQMNGDKPKQPIKSLKQVILWLLY